MSTPAVLHNCVVLQHPYWPEGPTVNQPIDLVRHQVLDLEVPHAKAYNPASKTFGGFSTLNHNAAMLYRSAMEDFLGIARLALELSRRQPDPQIRDVRLMYISVLDPSTYTSMVEDEQTPLQRTGKKYYSHLLRLVTTKPVTDGSDYPHTFANMQKVLNTQQERIAAETAAKKSAKKNRGDEEVKVDEVAERRKKESYGVSNVYDLPTFVNDNAARFRGGANVVAVPDKYIWLPYLTKSKWPELVHRMHRLQASDVVDIDNERCPYNPLRVFSPFAAFASRCNQLRRDPHYNRMQPEINLKDWFCWVPDAHYTIDNRNQINLAGIQCFATPYEGQTCWLLSIPDFGPDSFVNRLFPWATSHVCAANDSAARSYRDGTQLRSDYELRFLPSEDQAVYVNLSYESMDDVEKLYRHQVNQKPMLAAGYTKRRWKEECAAARAADEALLRNESPQRHREVEERTKRNNLARFIDLLFTEEPSNSRACRALVKWFNTRKLECQDKTLPLSLSIPRDYTHPNLSTFGDAVAVFCSGLTELLFVEQGHEVIFRGVLASLQVHLRECMTLSQVQFSPKGGPGKSFVLKTTQRHMIDDTWMAADTITPMMFSASDHPKDEDGRINMLDCMTLMQDELQTTLVAESVVSKPGQDTQAAILKSLLSKGEYTHMSCVFKSGVEDRTMGVIKADARVSFQAATNAPERIFSHAFKTRMVLHKADFVDKEMNELTGGAITQMDNEQHQTREDRIACDLHLQRAHRNQLLAYVVGCQIEAGNMHTIDTSAALALWRGLSEVQSDDRFNLSGFDQPRNYEHVKAYTQAMVLWDVFDQVFDLPNAPLYNAEWDWNYLFAYIEPRLVATVDHAAMAFGLLRTRFENIDYMRAKDLLYKWFYQQHEHKESAPAQLQPERQADGTVVSWRPPAERNVFTVVYHKSDPVRAPHVFWCEAQVANADFLHGVDPHSQRGAGRGADDTSICWQVVKLGSALKAFNAEHRYHPHHLLDNITQSLNDMLDHLIEVPSWSSRGELTVQEYGYRQLVAQLAMNHNRDNNTWSIRVPLTTGWKEISRPNRLSNTCLKDAVQYVLQTEQCTSRDVLFGATEVGMPDIWQTIPLLSATQLRKSGAVLKPSHNVTVREGGRLVPEGHEIVGDYDTWFIERFNEEHGYSRLMRNLYPPQDPVERMMELWAYTKVPYNYLNVPYPMQHRGFFPGALRMQKEVVVAKNMLKRQKLLMAPNEDAADAEDRLDAVIAERAAQRADTFVAVTRRGWTYPTLTNEPFKGRKTFARHFRKWLHYMVHPRRDVHALIADWVTGVVNVDADETKLPKHILSPITRARISKDPREKNKYKFIKALWKKSVRTLSNSRVDKSRHTVRMQGVSWCVVNGSLQLQPQRRLPALMPADDDDVVGAEMARIEEEFTALRSH